MNNWSLYWSIVLSLIVFAGCGDQNTQQEPPSAEGVDFRSAAIYEMNIRQHTAEGTFRAAMSHLADIRDLGVDILWLMPIHPIGEKNRKGRLGSYYSIRDYKGINPNFGSPEDFQMLVDSAHALGMKVILDWVANHTAWDHPWVENHPNFYSRDSTGKFPIVPPGTDWTDVADLDYDEPALRDSMIRAMQYWLEGFDVDGFRCDVAGFVPYDFWEEARKTLEKVKPIFMLAEWEDPQMHEYFEMTYAWEFHALLHDIAEKNNRGALLDSHYRKEWQNYPASAFRMNFITNHDENSWQGSVFDRYGAAVTPLAVLTFTIHGMPLVYSGQEVGLDRSLRFFDKDTIEWKASPWRDFYKNLIQLKKQESPLWNGHHGAPFVLLPSPSSTLAYQRQNDESSVIVCLNFSGETATVTLEEDAEGGATYMASEDADFSGKKVKLPAYGYWIGLKNKSVHHGN